MKKERCIHELYAEDSEKADWLVWGRKTDPMTRRVRQAGNDKKRHFFLRQRFVSRSEWTQYSC
ncbi:MAG: hypothetical protein ABFS56_13830 [Pseudomonadota bacterium]